METLSVLSTIIAVMAACVSVITYYEMRKIAKIQTNLDLVNRGNDLIRTEPKLLELHGISQKDLSGCGIDHLEFLYILNSFYAGHAYHVIEGVKKVKLSAYRKNMLDQEKIKLSWKNLIRNRMISPGPYANAVDEHYGLN